MLETDGVGFVGAGDGDSVDSLEFSASQEDAIVGITSALGEPVDVGDQAECPAGEAAFARWEDGFSATFQEGLFVGWTASGDSTLRTVDGVGLGSSLADVQAAFPGAMVEETSLGLELVGAELYGTVTGDGSMDTVDALWAGTTCIFR